jgi:hypothetical protein
MTMKREFCFKLNIVNHFFLLLTLFDSLLYPIVFVTRQNVLLNLCTGLYMATFTSQFSYSVKATTRIGEKNTVFFYCSWRLGGYARWRRHERGERVWRGSGCDWPPRLARALYSGSRIFLHCLPCQIVPIVRKCMSSLLCWRNSCHKR